jgi:hypothetical protein
MYVELLSPGATATKLSNVTHFVLYAVFNSKGHLQVFCKPKVANGILLLY